MKSFLNKYHLAVFYGTWLLLNLIQAAGTGLFDDEAYYWIYSHFLAWGYFDHPPMIAWLIKAGYAIFPNELGVRLFIVLMNTATLFIIQQLCRPHKPVYFYAVAGSIAVAQIGGMIAVPDLPLLFFTALFYRIYQKFVQQYTLTYSIALGICMALMLYSKYHGVLIIVATLASNPSLFRKYQAYLAAGIGIILFFPHLYWQYQHGFPSVQFHLFERNATHYRFSFTIEYILGQLALAGPVSGWLILWAAFKQPAGTETQKALRYGLVGIYAFFLLNTLKGRVEANWTIPAFVGLMVLSQAYFALHHKAWRILVFLLPVSLLLVLAARLFMLLPLAPSSAISKDEFHGNRANANAVSAIAGQWPVVMLDSYQKASKYWFYAQKQAFALNTPFYRRNNFNFWPIEDDLIGKPALVIGPRDSIFTNPLSAPAYAGNGWKKISSYYSFSRVMISHITVQSSGDTLTLQTSVKSPPGYLPYFIDAAYGSVPFWLAVYDERGDVSHLIRSENSLQQIHQPQQSLRLKFVNDLHGTYTCKLGIGSCIPGKPSLNSTGFKVTFP